MFPFVNDPIMQTWPQGEVDISLYVIADVRDSSQEKQFVHSFQYVNIVERFKRNRIQLFRRELFSQQFAAETTQRERNG